MGIRFLCPNGHKLNVKSFLAGKRGICPHCQSKFQIPQESDPSLISAGSSASSESPVPDLSHMPVVPSAVVHGGRQSGQVSLHPVETEPEAGSHDPISEAPHAVWYVRPPSGGQFGPASADVMRNWLSEGRVPNDALIWREGWAEWQTASQLFPGRTDPGTRSATPDDLPKIVTETAPERRIKGRMRHERSRKTNSLLVGALAIACVALFFVLLFILQR